MKEYGTNEQTNAHLLSRVRGAEDPKLTTTSVNTNFYSTATRDYRFQKPISFSGLLTNHILTRLPGEDFARLLPYFEPISLIGDQPIFKFGETISFIYFPESAVVSHLYFLEDGSAAGAGLVGNEGLLGLSAILDARPALYWTQLTIGGSAIRVRSQVIKDEFNRGGAMQKLVLQYARLRMSHLSQIAVCSGRHSMKQRLCTWLLMVADRASEESLPLTHEKIAQYLGARRAGVSTTCKELRVDGTISYSRGRLRITNVDKLRLEACECYSTLRQFSDIQGGNGTSDVRS